MPQDAFTLFRLAEELNDKFNGGKINRIIQPSFSEVLFTVYTGKGTAGLYVSVDPASPRIGVSDEEMQGPLTCPNFCMLLRKHLLNATIKSVSVEGFDRIVKIVFLSSSEFSLGEEKTLYVELMGRYSNVILTEGGKVLGCNRGINTFDGGVRPLIVGKKYCLPPANGKVEPTDNNLTERLKNSDVKEDFKRLSDTVQGISVSTAKEIIFRFNEAYANEEISGEKFVGFLREFLFSFPSQPVVYEENGAVKDVCVFPYKTSENSGFDSINFSRISDAENYYFAAKEKVKRCGVKRERISAALSSALKKVKKKLSLLSAKEKDAESLDKDRIKGELLLCNLYRLKGGEDKVVLPNFYDNNAEIEITLDKSLTPSDNAQAYFKRYAKKSRTLKAIKPQKETLENEAEYLSAVADEIELAETETDLDMIAEEMKESGLIKSTDGKNRKKKSVEKYRNYIVGGIKVKLGRNNVENDEVTFSAPAEYLWMHAKDCHSAHLIVESKNPPENVLKTCAEICAYFSKGRLSGKVEIAYTLKKHVKKPTGAKKGKVIYTDYHTISVAPDEHRELSAKGQGKD